MLNFKDTTIDSKGFTLIEIGVTLLILSISLLSLSTLHLSTIKSMKNLQSHSHAIWLTNSLANRIDLNKENLDQYITQQAITCEDIPTSSLKYCANPPPSSNKQLSWCDAKEDLPTFDLWDVLCGHTIKKTVTHAASLTFSDAKLSIDKTSPDGEINITIYWQNTTKTDLGSISSTTLSYSQAITL
jgi:prepilin-type N-terminal cleavage/methylation domain-containing protein